MDGAHGGCAQHTPTAQTVQRIYPEESPPPFKQMTGPPLPARVLQDTCNAMMSREGQRHRERDRRGHSCHLDQLRHILLGDGQAVIVQDEGRVRARQGVFVELSTRIIKSVKPHNSADNTSSKRLLPVPTSAAQNPAPAPNRARRVLRLARLCSRGAPRSTSRALSKPCDHIRFWSKAA